METKTCTAEEVLSLLSDKARISRIGSMVAIKKDGNWFVGRLDTSLGVNQELGLRGNEDHYGWLGITRAEKVLILD